MKAVSLALLAAVTVGSTAIPAQRIQVPGSPVQPGVPFQVVLTNNTSAGFWLSAEPLLHLLRPTGELIAPEIVGCNAVGDLFGPGATANLTFTVPATGPGSSGSYVLLFPYGPPTATAGAVARLDVGAPSAGFPDIHAFPVNTPLNAAGHHVVFPPNRREQDWMLANTGSTNHTFAWGSVDVFAPGGSVPVASLGLAGLTVRAGGVLRLFLPLTGLAPGPYTVQTQWFDPATGTPMVVRHGIEASTDTRVDLHLPGGHVVPFAGSIPARLAMGGGIWSTNLTTSTPIAYALLLGFLPGSTPLPGGAILPLLPDPFVQASFAGGLGGVLTNAQGLTTLMTTSCAHRTVYVPSAGGLGIQHPILPVATGLTLRAAAIALDLQGNLAASQPEEIRFQ